MYYCRGTARISSKKMNTTKASTTAISEAGGDECITQTEVFTKESGMTTNEMAMECSDYVSQTIHDLIT